ncbi:MAG: GAF domain-containing protein [Isosphaeraceae bacterium]
MRDDVSEDALHQALSDCEQEPIHIPGSIQPHGCLLAVRWPDPRICFASQNVGPYLGLGESLVVGSTLEEVFGAEPARLLADNLDQLEEGGSLRHLGSISLSRGEGATVAAVVHRHAGYLILEFEHERKDTLSGLGDLYGTTTALIAKLSGAADVAEIYASTAAEVRRLTGFDRVLVYRFSPDGSGTVVAEDRNEILPSYLGHRFPSSDIPKQARDLYRLNRLRLIADASYVPVPIVSEIDTGAAQPLDLTFATLRSVSPVHVEYMRNMGTAASMSISVMRGDELWGLISCHHGEPRVVPFLVRAVCDFVGQVLSLQLDAKEHQAEVQRSLASKRLQTRLLQMMTAQENYVDGLAEGAQELLGLVSAQGAAVVSDGRFIQFGSTPNEEEIRSLVEWLSKAVGREVYCTQSLVSEFPQAESYKHLASGLLAITISKLHPSYVLWFRPEVAQTVTWAGNPRKSFEYAGDRLRLHPRRSFAMWRETVRLKSEPFHPSEVEAAVELRNSIIGIVLRRAEERASLSEELARSNKELEAFSYSVSHDLRAPFRHIVGYAELLRDHAGTKLDSEELRFLQTICDAAYQAGQLVDSLLAYSRMGRARLVVNEIDMNRLIEEIRETVMRDAVGRRVRWTIGRLPHVECDVTMIRQLFENLLSNALKYTRTRDEAQIEIGATTSESEHEFFVRDNGIGFDLAYAGKLFGVFQRMHRMEDFEGTGIGLANVRRIAARHGGRTWAVSAVEQGATFFVTLPVKPVDNGGSPGALP